MKQLNAVLFCASALLANAVNAAFRFALGLLLLLGPGLIYPFQSPGQVTNGFTLSLKAPDENGWRGLSATDFCEGCLDLQLYRIDASTDLTNWIEIARLHDAPFTFFDAASPSLGQRFYRGNRRPREVSLDDWKNQVAYKKELAGGVGDPFANGGLQESGFVFVKFAILRSDPTRVYFQNTLKYPLHYDFAMARLPGFVGLSRDDFDQVSLYTNNQQVVLGTVLLPGDLEYPHLEAHYDYGIQFVANDPLPAASIVDWFRLVKSAVVSPVPITPFYVPSPLQAASAQANASFFASNGLPLTTVARWLNGDTVYSEGWALGRLVFVPGNEISIAYFDGRLSPNDILLTDIVPAEVPFVAGIICLNAATPSSHVAILAQAYKIPFAFVADEPLRSSLMPLAGRKVIFSTARSFNYGNTPVVSVVDVDGALTPAFEQEVLIYKDLPPVNIRPKETYGAFSAPVTNLVPDDSRFFGGKAANYGLLRRVIPSNSPVALAFSMDLWDVFMDQTLSGGASLRTEISNRLAGWTYSPTNLAAIQNILTGIRTLIRNTASFNATQKVAILTAVSSFPPDHNIRFRSSSNAEDSESFTAAGLLDSYSGCIADDTDGDTSGPSACDSTEMNERGVFRAIQRVYSSFYNDNAYLERLRHGINEAEVGVGVLVHQSFPDATEVANGVATARVYIDPAPFNRTNVVIQLVSQPGAASVTNPSDDAQAEVAGTQMIAFQGTTNYYFSGFAAHSSLLPQGITALGPADCEAFSRLLFDLSVGYHAMFPGKDSFTLDFEYKKLTNGSLTIKQVREIPPTYVTNVVPYLVSDPSEVSLFQGESGDATVNHHLKLRGTFRTKTIQLTASNLAQHFFTAMHFEYYSNGAIGRFDAEADALTNLVHSVEGNAVTDTIPADSTHPAFLFRMEFPATVQGNVNPFVTLTTVRFERAPADEPSVRLLRTAVVKTNSFLQTREFTGALMFDGTNRPVTVRTLYYWPDGREILANGYTASLVQFVETTISGLTATPMVLTNHFSQSYGTSHHNLIENLLFEPRIDPNVSPEQLVQLSGFRLNRIKLRVYNPDRSNPLERSYTLESETELTDD